MHREPATKMKFSKYGNEKFKREFMKYLTHLRINKALLKIKITMMNSSRKGLLRTIIYYDNNMCWQPIQFFFNFPKKLPTPNCLLNDKSSSHFATRHLFYFLRQLHFVSIQFSQLKV
jgi:hypothetical protein